MQNSQEKKEIWVGKCLLLGVHDFHDMSLLVIWTKGKRFSITFLELISNLILAQTLSNNFSKGVSYKIKVNTKLVGSAVLLLSYPGCAREGWITRRCQKKTPKFAGSRMSAGWVQVCQFVFQRSKNSKVVTAVCRVPVYLKMHGFNLMKPEESVRVNGDHITLLCRLFSLCDILSGHAIDFSISVIHKKKSY